MKLIDEIDFELLLGKIDNHVSKKSDEMRAERLSEICKLGSELGTLKNLPHKAGQIMEGIGQSSLLDGIELTDKQAKAIIDRILLVFNNRLKESIKQKQIVLGELIEISKSVIRETADEVSVENAKKVFYDKPLINDIISFKTDEIEAQFYSWGFAFTKSIREKTFRILMREIEKSLGNRIGKINEQF